MKCLTCNKDFTPQKHCNNMKFCSINCRNKLYRQKNKDKLNNNQSDKRQIILEQTKDTKECLLCGKCFIQLGSHVIQIHEVTAREYREYFSLEVKKGITPNWYKKLKGNQALKNGTYKNLKKGKDFWFKKGKSNNYKRSPITIKRIQLLHTKTKRYKNNTLPTNIK